MVRIHTNTLTAQNLREAAQAAGMRDVHAEGIIRRGSRSRDHAFEVALSGTNTRWANSGTRGAARSHAATWDEWGMFMEALYQADPDALIGDYGDHETFREVTFCRFDNLTQVYQHSVHAWRVSDGVQTCIGCEAQFNSGDLYRIRQSQKAQR